MQTWNEKSLEDLLVNYLIETHGYTRGHSAGFDREHGFDRAMLLQFLDSTQPDELAAWKAEGGAHWQEKLGKQLFETIGKKGIAAVWREGFKCGACRFALYYPRPVGASTAEQQARWAANLFSVTQQLHFAAQAAHDALDVAVFVNGLPLATIEVKNAFTGQNVTHAMRQYREDRPTREALFGFARCAVHFALDSDEIWMTSHLRGDKTHFLPFNRGTAEGGGNPPNPEGLKTAYLWEDVFAPASVGELVEKFLQLVEDPNDDGSKQLKPLFPRYHQRAAVQQLLSAGATGAGQRYLIQHSAGSGKSNTIAWLCYGLIELNDANAKPLFDSVILVTDRRVLDRQISNTLKNFAHAPGLVEHAAKGSWQLRDALQNGKRIIITTIQKFPYILQDIGALPQSRFAIVIDEAHSSQGGRAATEMGEALRGGQLPLEGDYEDKLNALIDQHKMLNNASYFAFTATPKPKTLEIFGLDHGEAAHPRFVPFHEYTMKQAIAERFILDVLRNYTTYQTFYTVIKTTEDTDDPEFDKTQAQKKLRALVEKNPQAIDKKAAIMIEHFRREVAHRLHKNAKAMVVTSGIENAIRYRLAFNRILEQENLPYQALVAFTGEKTVDGLDYTEETMNNLDSGKIPAEFKKPEFRFLIVAEKFQTGFDEPLLHTMYVDKPLGGVQAVQTLSRLNRCHPDKTETFVLDFVNKAEAIKAAFEPFYGATHLIEATDLNRLNQLQDDIEGAHVFSPEERTAYVRRYLNGETRASLEATLDQVFTPRYQALSPDEQIKFKGDYKSFNRAYQFLASIRAFKRADWEELAILGGFLVPKLPAPADDDTTKGVLEATALQSYRVVRRDAQLKIELEGDSEVEPAQIPGGGLRPKVERDRLSAIIHTFNERYGKPLTPSQEQFLGEELPQKLNGDATYQAAKINTDRQNAHGVYVNNFRAELQKRIFSETDLFKKLSDDQDLRAYLIDALFEDDYRQGGVSD